MKHIDENNQPNNQIFPGRKISYIVGRKRIHLDELKKMPWMKFKKVVGNYPKAIMAFIYKSQGLLPGKVNKGDLPDIGLLVVAIANFNSLVNKLELPNIPDGLVFILKHAYRN